MALQLTLSNDVPAAARHAIQDGWASIGGLEPQPDHYRRSPDAEAFIQILGAAADWWLPLKAAALVFLSQLAKDAATDLYKNKAAVARALGQAGAAALRTAAGALNRARGSGAMTVLGLSTPDDIFGTAIAVPADASDEELTYVLAAFVVKSEAIESAIKRELAAGARPIATVQLIPQQDGGFQLVWLDRADKEGRITVD